METLVRGVKAAAGLDTTETTGSEGTKTEEFYTTLATYPFLHLSANAPARLPVLHKMCGALDLSRKVDDTAPASPHSATDEALRERVRTAITSQDAVSAHLGGLKDYMEGRALMEMERYHSVPLILDTKTSLLLKLRDYITDQLVAQDPTLVQSTADRERLDRITTGVLQTPMGVSTGTGLTGSPKGVLAGDHGLTDTTTVESRLAAEVGAGEGYPGRNMGDMAHDWFIWGCRKVLPVLNAYLGPNPPTIPVDKVVDHMLYFTSEPDALSTVHGVGTMSLDVPPGPVTRLTAALRPNVQHITREQMRRVTLTRNRTLVEYANVALGLVRWWLGLVARFFFLLGIGLRIFGNGLSALGGLVAFTVVLSIAISVLSALTFLAASAADATGTFMIYMARFTDVAKRRSDMGTSGMTKDKIGPLTLGPATADELEEFIGRQMSLRRASPAVRTRPDVPRLAHSTLLVKCYDLGLIDANGALYPHVTLEEVMEHFDSEGFFGHAPMRIRLAAAQLLLRQLALRHVKSLMAPPTFAGETERALRYVFLGGVRHSGVDTLYRELTGLPTDYVKGDTEQLYNEMRPILGHPASYLIITQSHTHANTPAIAPATDTKAPTTRAELPSWVTHPSHGVISCLVYLVTLETSLEDVGLSVSGGVTGVSGVSESEGVSVSGGVKGGDLSRGTVGHVYDRLDDVWQALAQRKPVLLAVTKCSQYKVRLQTDPSAAEKAKAYWTTALREEAARRGLESELITVLLTELDTTPPLGAAGLPQVQDWVTQVLADAPTLRCT